MGVHGLISLCHFNVCQLQIYYCVLFVAQSNSHESVRRVHYVGDRRTERGTSRSVKHTAICLRITSCPGIPAPLTTPAHPVFFFGGEQDGPTHQPVETVSGLRVFPNMDVMRPADPEETAAAYAAALDRKDGPTALILTRQNVRTLKEIPVSERWRWVSFRFAYIRVVKFVRILLCAASAVAMYLGLTWLIILMIFFAGVATSDGGKSCSALSSTCLASPLFSHNA